MNGYKDKIIEVITHSSPRLTLSDLVKSISSLEKLSPVKVRNEIRELVDKGVLEYQNELGHTFPVISFNMGVRLSGRIIAHPPDVMCKRDNPTDIFVKIEKSTSFGRGNHPTTRLSLKAIEKAFEEKKGLKGSVFDAGCGTGILAISSVLMGMDTAYALDIDPVAIYDCKKNISLNDLDNKIKVSSKWPEKEKYDLICANLRPPTLIEYKERFSQCLNDSGAIVFSGFKPEEESWLIKDLSGFFNLFRVWRENDWSSALMFP